MVGSIYGLSVTHDNFPDWFSLTGNHDRLILTRVDGLNPPPVNINTSTGGTIDGTFFNSARVQQRNIVLTILPRGNIEDNRRLLYRLFPINQIVTLRYFSTGRTVEIQGYIEAIEGSLFENPQTFTVSIVCPRPFWQDVQSTEIIVTSTSTQLVNAGDVENGVEIVADFENLPSGTGCRGLTISNTATGEHIEFTNTFTINDYLTICTIQGRLAAYFTRSGTNVNLLKYIASGSSWLKMRKGNNYLAISTDNSTESYVNMQLTHYNQYVGV